MTLNDPVLAPPTGMTDDTIRELRALLERATPGPWGQDFGVQTIVGEIAAGGVLVGTTIDQPDAALIVAAVNAVRSLLDAHSSEAAPERLAQALSCWSEPIKGEGDPECTAWAAQMIRAYLPFETALTHRLYSRDGRAHGPDDPMFCACGEPWPCPASAVTTLEGALLNGDHRPVLRTPTGHDDPQLECSCGWIWDDDTPVDDEEGADFLRHIVSEVAGLNVPVPAAVGSEK